MCAICGCMNVVGTYWVIWATVLQLVPSRGDPFTQGDSCTTNGLTVEPLIQGPTLGWD